MHSMTLCPRQTVYALPRVGVCGSQAGGASFIDEGVNYLPGPDASLTVGSEPCRGSGSALPVCLLLDTCCSCKPGGCNTPWVLLPASGCDVRLTCPAGSGI